MTLAELKPYDFSLVVSETDSVFQHLVKEYNKAVKFYGLDGWRMGFDNAKRRAGLCRYRTKTINLSVDFVKLNSLEIVIGTVRHELAHAISHTYFGERGHGYTWKRVAIAIGDDGERCCGSDVKMAKGRFVYVCPKCSKESHYHRTLKRAYACSDCCRKYNYGKFSMDFKLVLQ